MRAPRTALARAAAAALAAALIGCASLWNWGLRPPDAGHACPGALVPTQELPADVLLRVQAHVTSGDADFGMGLVARRKGDALVLIGLDGFGTVLFSLTQQGVDVSVERAYGRRQPWPPENWLRDLHRLRFLALPGAPLPNGTHRGTRAGAAIEERWDAGQLRRRRIARGAGEVVEIERDPDSRSLLLRNPGCGYSARFSVLEEALPPGLDLLR